MALRDWFLPKQLLVGELSDMRAELGISDETATSEYWSKKSKGVVIGEIEDLMYTTGRHWCTDHGWTCEPCDC